MIENYPEWNGFLVSRSFHGGGRTRTVLDLMRAVWLRQAGPGQRSGTVLHHAAVFFEWTEPVVAEGLLNLAIEVEPAAPFHVEGLGSLYASAQFRIANSPFAIRAKTLLLSSTNPLMLVGALNAISPYAKGAHGEVRKWLMERLRELGEFRDPMDLVRKLPSLSAHCRRAQCPQVHC